MSDIVDEMGGYMGDGSEFEEPTNTAWEASLDATLDKLMYEARHYNQKGNEGWLESKNNAKLAIKRITEEQIIGSDDIDPSVTLAYHLVKVPTTHWADTRNGLRVKQRKALGLNND